MLLRDSQTRRVTIIAAYPGDETLWAGGHILSNPNWQWTVAALFRPDAPNNIRRFSRALKRLDSEGESLGLSAATEKQPALKSEIASAVLRVVDKFKPDLLITHSPLGESVQLRDRDVVGRIITKMWEHGEITTRRLWVFAYEDNGGLRLPMAIDTSDRYICLSNEIYKEKKEILQEIYRFSFGSYVVKACLAEEAFYCFANRTALRDWQKKAGRG